MHPLDDPNFLRSIGAGDLADSLEADNIAARDENRRALAAEIERLRSLLIWVAARTGEGLVLKRIAKDLDFTQGDWDLVRSLAPDNS